jgi:ABC-type antimicrobial peptide transport system permease subunit
LKTGAVTAVAGSESTTTDIWGTDSELDWKGKDPNITLDFPNTGVSVDYGKTVGWQFIEGRDFSRKFASDSTAFILNEAAVKFMGLNNPVGEVVRWKGNPFTVIGVIKDMVVESPYDPVRPSIYCLARGHDNFAIVKLNTSINTRAALQQIETVFRKYSPSAPFEFEFINERYDRKFTSEEQVGKLASFFTILAVFISCLGIFAMALFMAEQRSREIGVRKVFGASVFSVWRLLSKEFTQLIFLAWVIALPVGYFVMFNWLENYHYRTNISWWILAVAAMGALFITLVTVSFQSIKAALANPVKSLRNA